MTAMFRGSLSEHVRSRIRSMGGRRLPAAVASSEPQGGHIKRRAFLRTGLTGAGVAGIAAAHLAAPLAGATAARGLDTIFNPRRPGRDYNGPVRLSSNENPLGIAPSARQAIVDGLDEANRYPGATGELVREALVARLGVKPGQLFFGSGSTEILRIASAAWAAPFPRRAARSSKTSWATYTSSSSRSFPRTGTWIGRPSSGSRTAASFRAGRRTNSASSTA